jgi:hypothetical protein
MSSIGAGGSLITDCDRHRNRFTERDKGGWAHPKHRALSRIGAIIAARRAVSGGDREID